MSLCSHTHQLGVEAGHEEARRLEDGVRRPAGHIRQEQHLLPVPQAGNDLQHDQSRTVERRARTKRQLLSPSRKSPLSPPGAAACSAIAPGTVAVLQSLQAAHNSQQMGLNAPAVRSQARDQHLEGLGDLAGGEAAQQLAHPVVNRHHLGVQPRRHHLPGVCPVTQPHSSCQTAAVFYTRAAPSHSCIHW